jgi:hypothetical protein
MCNITVCGACDVAYGVSRIPKHIRNTKIRLGPISGCSRVHVVFNCKSCAQDVSQSVPGTSISMLGALSPHVVAHRLLAFGQCRCQSSVEAVIDYCCCDRFLKRRLVFVPSTRPFVLLLDLAMHLHVARPCYWPSAASRSAGG